MAKALALGRSLGLVVWRYFLQQLSVNLLQKTINHFMMVYVPRNDMVTGRIILFYTLTLQPVILGLGLGIGLDLGLDLKAKILALVFALKLKSLALVLQPKAGLGVTFAIQTLGLGLAVPGLGLVSTLWPT